MLPGFRFLFATIVLAISILIFGLGAAALLRASHEEFANLPSWRLTQQPQFMPSAETTLALLRVAGPPAKSPVPETLSASVVQSLGGPPVIAQPVVAITSGSADPVKNTDQPAAQLAQASADAPPATEEPAAVEPVETMPSDTIATEPAIAPDARSPETKSSDTGSSQTEASEPQTTQSVTPQVRSTAATAAETLPKLVVKKAKRSNAQAIARRRQIIARARAAARAKAVQQQQPNSAFPLFGG